MLGSLSQSLCVVVSIIVLSTTTLVSGENECTAFASTPCNSRGVCITIGFLSSCVCDLGWIGLSCEIQLLPTTTATASMENATATTTTAPTTPSTTSPIALNSLFNSILESVNIPSSDDMDTNSNTLVSSLLDVVNNTATTTIITDSVNTLKVFEALLFSSSTNSSNNNLFKKDNILLDLDSFAVVPFYLEQLVTFLVDAITNLLSGGTEWENVVVVGDGVLFIHTDFNFVKQHSTDTIEFPAAIENMIELNNEQQQHENVLSTVNVTAVNTNLFACNGSLLSCPVFESNSAAKELLHSVFFELSPANISNVGSVSVIFYDNPSAFVSNENITKTLSSISMTPQNTTTTNVSVSDIVVATNIISVQVNEGKHFEGSIRIFFLIEEEFKERLNSINNDNETIATPHCVYWNFFSNTSGAGEWASDGCRLVEDTRLANDNRDNSNIVVCECNHLTNFAVLFTLGNATSVSTTNTQSYTTDALLLISRIGTYVSIPCLCATMLILLWFKHTRNDFNKMIVLHISANLLVVYLLFLTGSRPQLNINCVAFAIVMHFFLISSFLWMLVQALQMYCMYVLVFATPKVLRILLTPFCSTIFAYGVASALIGLTLIIFGIDGYGGELVCFLNPLTLAPLMFIVPVAAILVINTIAFIRVYVSVSSLVKKSEKSQKKTNLTPTPSSTTTSSKDNSGSISFSTDKLFLATSSSDSSTTYSSAKQIKLGVKLTFTYGCVLGLSWVFGYLLFTGIAVFAYPFLILTSLQGLFLFVFHVLNDKRIRQRLCFGYNKKKRRTVFLKNRKEHLKRIQSKTTTHASSNNKSQSKNKVNINDGNNKVSNDEVIVHIEEDEHMSFDDTQTFPSISPHVINHHCFETPKQQQLQQIQQPPNQIVVDGRDNSDNNNKDISKYTIKQFMSWTNNILGNNKRSTDDNNKNNNNDINHQSSLYFSNTDTSTDTYYPSKLEETTPSIRKRKQTEEMELVFSSFPRDSMSAEIALDINVIDIQPKNERPFSFRTIKEDQEEENSNEEEEKETQNKKEDLCCHSVKTISACDIEPKHGNSDNCDQQNHAADDDEVDDDKVDKEEDSNYKNKYVDAEVDHSTCDYPLTTSPLISATTPLYNNNNNNSRDETATITKRLPHPPAYDTIKKHMKTFTYKNVTPIVDNINSNKTTNVTISGQTLSECDDVGIQYNNVKTLLEQKTSTKQLRHSSTSPDIEPKQQKPMKTSQSWSSYVTVKDDNKDTDEKEGKGFHRTLSQLRRPQQLNDAFLVDDGTSAKGTSMGPFALSSTSPLATSSHYGRTCTPPPSYSSVLACEPPAHSLMKGKEMTRKKKKNGKRGRARSSSPQLNHHQVQQQHNANNTAYLLFSQQQNVETTQQRLASNSFSATKVDALLF
eukprot:m.144222 g.144222  ORF g.144222 m.144222 type:complete len:1386 (-) comp13220_c0_seq3:1716-5873(-)